MLIFHCLEMTLKVNCKESVFNYLSNQNRPFSANDVMQNLHKEFGKTAIQKALEDLTSECKIKEKTYGKQKVFSVIQREENEAHDVALQLAAFDSKIEEMDVKLKSAEQNLKKAELNLKELEKEPFTEKAMKEKNELEMCVVRLQKKIEAVSKGSIEITEKEKREISGTHDIYTKEHKKRKRLCMDMVNSVMENYPENLKSLFEEIGIEADENKSDSV